MLNNKVNWALGLSIAAIILFLGVLWMWIFEEIPHSVVLPETFIGVCVAMFGLIVTLGVGMQIINVMELKSAQKKFESELETALNQLQKQQQEMNEECYHNQHIHHCSIALLAEMQKAYPSAIYYYIGALLNGLQMKEPLENENFILEHMSNCLDKCGNDVSIPEYWKDNLKNNDQVLRKLSNYRWIKGKYEPLRDKYFKKAGINIE